MRKIGKTRKGFTLVEMVLVIAIIVILAGVLVIGIGSYLNKARAATSSVTEHNSSVEMINSEIDARLG
ncbi:MAG: type II secretion system protein [Lachnospiraceae bacterium]|nr:type II secretion system protein [Lachnospiraceae bacterium]